MIQSVSAVPASAQDYLDHARACNDNALSLLRLHDHRAATLEAKLSYAMSFQAAELAGKSLLRSLGLTPDQIKAQYRNHNLMALLQGADELLRKQPDQDLKPFHHFLLKQTVINGQPYFHTYGRYLADHFATGDMARPRNYLYPDLAQFTLLQPINAMHAIVEYLIEVAQSVADIIGPAP